MKKSPPPAGRQAHSVPEAAKQLSVSRPKAFELIASGQLRSFRIGRRRLVSDEAISDYILQAEADEAAA